MSPSGVEEPLWRLRIRRRDRDRRHSLSEEADASLRAASHRQRQSSHRRLARGQTLTQRHPLPQGIFRMKCCTDHCLDGLRIGAARIALSVEPRIGSQRQSHFVDGLNSALQRHHIDDRLGQERRQRAHGISLDLRRDGSITMHGFRRASDPPAGARKPRVLTRPADDGLRVAIGT